MGYLPSTIVAEEVVGTRPYQERQRNDREVDVPREIAIGSSIQQAAGALQVSAKTVDFHLQNVYAKAGITTRAAAALFAVQHDLLNA